MKRKNKPIKITYTHVKDDTSNFRLEKVFDMIFNEVQRKRCANKLNTKEKIKKI